MAPSFSIKLRETERGQLLRIARQSIRNGLQGGDVLEVALHELSDALTSRLGVFVTLTQQDTLRGCIGAMQSSEPLARSVAESAYGAAFRDHRFPPLTTHELALTSIEISVLSPMAPMSVESRSELLSTLQPEVDGLLLQDRHHRSTFLPKVWEQLPEPEAFLAHLLAKAGLPTDHWSTTLQFYRYSTVSFGEVTAAA
ncbi:MAG: AMMECR1 domain-containing protein [Gammaproteobacteria bacterium]|nr:MAG: AMMECR1 domain-containing protein [Gammaproteobacteria bacterium]RLA60138.1 MAG: AMMECR1 domain-containing protein [Gammaproteobacteria bacterium]